MMPSTPPQNIQWVQSPALATPLGPSSAQIVCTSCGMTIFTSTSRKAKSSAWWSCILLCICGCFFGCCLIPCCMDSCNVVNHTCPNCNSYLGHVKQCETARRRRRRHDADYVRTGIVDARRLAQTLQENHRD